MAITNTKQKMSSLRHSATMTSDLADSRRIIATCLKKSTASPIDVQVLTSKGKKQIIRDVIRLPRPQGGNLVYSVAEAIDVVSVLVRKNNEQNKHLP